MKQQMWWVQSLMKVYVATFIRHKNDMHVPAALQKLTIGGLVFELSKLKFRARNLDDGLLKGLIQYIINEARGVVGATPESMGHHIL